MALWHGRADLGFLLLLALVLIKPVSGTAINHWLGVAACGVAFLLFAASLGQRPPRHWWRRYRAPLILIGGFFLSYLFSTWVHRTAYPSLLELGFRALGPLAVISLFPMLWVILETGRPNRGLRLLVLLVLGLIELIGVLQPFFPQWVNPVRRYTVAADALPVITSLYRWHTILGTLSALLAIYGMIRLFQGQDGEAPQGNRMMPLFSFQPTPASASRPLSLRERGWEEGTIPSSTGRGQNQGMRLPRQVPRWLYALLTVTALLAGALSQSRNFLLTLLVGLAAWFIVSRQRLLLGLGLAIICLGLFHAVAWFSPRVTARYATALPYLGKLHRPAALTWQDFIPKVNTHSLSGRPRIWSKAVGLWRQSPWLGLGPGVFSLKSGFGKVHNAHNLFLQALVDAGVPGLVFCAAFWFWALWRSYGTPVFPLTLSALAALNFDNFLDKSMAWVLVTTWLAYDLARRT